MGNLRKSQTSATRVAAVRVSTPLRARSLATGSATLAPYGLRVSADTQQLVEARKAELVAGTLQVFQGPIYDNQGTLRAAPGQMLNGDDLLADADWVVEGVFGQLS